LVQSLKKAIEKIERIETRIDTSDLMEVLKGRIKGVL